MKTSPRSGWVYYGVGPRVESIADHTFRVALMALVAAQGPRDATAATPAGAPRVDWQRCVVLALMHDVSETIVGDITPLDGITHEVKEAREADAMRRLQALLAPWSPAAAAEVIGAWREYEDGATAEAKLVKDIDKVELMLQAAEYENADRVSSSNETVGSVGGGRLSLSSFYDLAMTRLKTSLGHAWAEEVLLRRGGAEGWETAARRLDTALEGAAPMVVPDLARRPKVAWLG